MKRPNAFLSLVLIVVLVYYSFSSLMPKNSASTPLSSEDFSVERALIPLREIAKSPHYYGSQDHKRVRLFLENELIKAQEMVRRYYYFPITTVPWLRPLELVMQVVEWLQF